MYHYTHLSHTVNHQNQPYKFHLSLYLFNCLPWNKLHKFHLNYATFYLTFLYTSHIKQHKCSINLQLHTCGNVLLQHCTQPAAKHFTWIHSFHSSTGHNSLFNVHNLLPHKLLQLQLGHIVPQNTCTKFFHTKILLLLWLQLLQCFRFPSTTASDI